MARRADPEKQYRVSSFRSGKYRYAGTQPGVLAPETGKRKYRHVILGKLDDNKKFIPKENFIYLSQEQREKLKFPKDWDLSEIDNIIISSKKEIDILKENLKSKKENQDDNLLYGDIWLLEKAAIETNLYDDLLKVFNYNIEIVKEILTIAYFPMCGKGSLNNILYWQKIAKTPTRIPLTPPLITKLTQSISEQKRCDLIRLRAKRLKENELCAVDSTTRLAYGSGLSDIKYGKSKEPLGLPQTIEIVAYGLDSHEPVYYRTVSGNTPDVRTLDLILYDLKNLNFDNVIIITDRGYDSENNMELYIERNQKIIMGTKLNHKFILEKIESLGAFNNHPKEMKYDRDHEIFYKQYTLEYISNKNGKEEIKELKYNLYFDPIKRAKEINSVYNEIYDQEENLKYIKMNKIKIVDFDSVNSIANYFNITYSDDDTIKEYEQNEDIINKKLKLCGFFSNTTFGVNFDAIEANSLYHLRDEQEKYFEKMKGIMHSDRQRASTDSGKSGRLFILFVSQILESYLSHHMSDIIKQKFQSIEGVLSEMRGIRYVQHPGAEPFITPFVGSQRLICEEFGFAIPEGCAPSADTQSSLHQRKRGRPKGGALRFANS